MGFQSVLPWASYLPWASLIGSSTNTLHSLLAILSVEMRAWSGGGGRALPLRGPTGGVAARCTITLPDLEAAEGKSGRCSFVCKLSAWRHKRSRLNAPYLTWFDLDACWWEKLWDRPGPCRSSSSLVAGPDGDDGDGECLLGDRGSAGGVDTKVENWSFSFMCWLNYGGGWARRECHWDHFCAVNWTYCSSVSGTGTQYLKESSPEDLEGHGEGEGGALPTLSQVVEGRAAHHCWVGPVVPLASSIS